MERDAGSNGRAKHQPNLWAIVLAGGEGVRLRPLVNRLYGEDRPKQYAALVGSRSMLRHTLDRAALAIPPERIVVVATAAHANYVAEEFPDSGAQRLLIQPENRGTAAAILYPAHWIRTIAPDAVVAIFPSDHFLLEEQAFMTHVLEAAAAAESHPEWMVLLGVKPTEPETEYGWLEPGEVVCPANIRRVRRFQEKPSYSWACESLARGDLWNTFVLVAKLDTLILTSNEFAPLLGRQLNRATQCVTGPGREWALQQAYDSMPHLNFSRAVLQRCRQLAVSEVSDVTWSDWGTARRVVRSLEKAGIGAHWLADEERRFWRNDNVQFLNPAAREEVKTGRQALRQ